MKRDADLIREILFQVEASPTTEDSIGLNFEEHDLDQVSYHVLLLHEAGLIVAVNEGTGYGEDENWKPIRLTWHGHEFLDAARDERRWGKVKKVMTKTGGLAMSVVEHLLIELVKDQVSKNLP